MSEPLVDLGISFKRYLAAEGKAQATIKLYMQAVRFYDAWIGQEHGRPGVLDDIRLGSLQQWFIVLHDRHKPNTVLMRWQGMNRFCNWLVDEEEIDKNPMKGIKRPVLKDSPVPLLDDADLAALVKACQGKEFNDRRDEAIIRLMLDCGIRVSEVCKLGVEELDVDACDALVHGKGGKDRMVYFGSRTARALDRYLRMRSRHRWSHLPNVFLGERGALTTDGVRTRMEVRAAKAGLNVAANPHRFRHTWADDFLFSGGQERDLKRLAGWSSDVMLEKYGRSGADRRAKAAAQKMRRGDRV